MKKRVVFYVLLFLNGALHAKSYQLSVQEAVDLAIKGNLSLKREEVALKTKERNKKWVANHFLPSINAGASFSFNLVEPSDSVVMVPDLTGPSLSQKGTTLYPNSSINTIKTAGKDLPKSVAGISLSVQLPLNASMFLSIDTAQQDYQSGLISYAAVEAQLERDVKKIYYNLILLDKTVALLESNLDTAQNRLNQATLQYNKGYAAKLQMLNAKAALENLRPQLTAQRHYRESALMNFKIYLGLDFDDEIELTEDQLEVLSYQLNANQLIENHLTDRMDIQLLMGNIRYLKSSKTAALVGALSPSLLFGLNYSGTTPLYPSGSPLKPEKSELNNAASFSMALSLPLDQLIYGSKGWQTEKTMQDNLEALELQLKNALRMAELDIRNQIMNLEKSWQLIESLQFNIVLNREVYEENEQGYQAGRVDIVDLQEAQDRFNQAKLTLIQEKVNYLGAVAELEYALNQQLTPFIKGE